MSYISLVNQDQFVDVVVVILMLSVAGKAKIHNFVFDYTIIGYTST